MNGFHKVSYKTQIFSRDFNETAVDCGVVKFSDTGATFSSAPVKCYKVGNDELVYFADGSLKLFGGGTFTDTGFTDEEVPLVVSVVINGERQLLFIGEDSAYSGGETFSQIPFGTSCAVFAGRLFVADGNTLKYSEEFDFTDFSVGLTLGGFINTEAESGDILFIYAEKNLLYVICKRAVYALSCFGEQFEFSVSKICSVLPEIQENSVCKIGDTVLFLSDNKCFTLIGGKIKRVGKALAGLSFTSGIAGEKNGLYVLPVVMGGKNYVYAYDLSAGKEVFRATGDFTVCGGYATKLGENKFYDYTVNVLAQDANQTVSGDYDFGTCRKKALTRLEFHVVGNADVVVQGEGTYRATVTQACSTLSCFLHGRSFNLSFENASQNFKVERFAAHYIIYGD